jgi:hypothetical protein
MCMTSTRKHNITFPPKCTSLVAFSANLVTLVGFCVSRIRPTHDKSAGFVCACLSKKQSLDSGILERDPFKQVLFYTVSSITGD